MPQKAFSGHDKKKTPARSVTELGRCRIGRGKKELLLIWGKQCLFFYFNAYEGGKISKFKYTWTWLVEGVRLPISFVFVAGFQMHKH